MTEQSSTTGVPFEPVDSVQSLVYIGKSLQKVIHAGPADMRTLAMRLGMTVIDCDLGDKAGATNKIDNGEMFILVNMRFGPEYQEFSIAHEIGHLIMHHGSDRDIPGHLADQEANLFAYFIAIDWQPLKITAGYLKSNWPDLERAYELLYSGWNELAGSKLKAEISDRFINPWENSHEKTG